MQNSGFNPVNQQVSKMDLFFEKLAICGKILLSDSSFFCVFKEKENGKKITDVRAINIDTKVIHETSGDIFIKTFDVVNESIVKEFPQVNVR